MNKGNYRLVSFLSHLSKVVEIILHNQHNGYMKNKLSNISYWLSKRSQCATLIDHDEKWKRALYENMKVGAIFMDISIAFDTLNHRLPLAKLKAYGLQLTALKQLENYLTGRFQRTKISSSYSSWSEINAVSQIIHFRTTAF